MSRDLGNLELAGRLARVADLLETQGASVHRVRAWRAGAEAVAAEPRPLAEIFRDEGLVGLRAIPHIGRGLAAILIELLTTGHARVLDRLEGEVTAIDVLADLPGLGPRLAHRLHDELGIESLEELEQAAHDGRLARVHGFGARRVRAVSDQLAARLGRQRALQPRPAGRPPVELLLELDHRYRALADEGKLRRIAPRRFNPDGAAWLPILHDERQGWHFTVLYSNTALAHELGRTHDWVVIYFFRDGEEGRATVVTETRGPRRGARVVRGREQEDAHPATAGATPGT